MKRAWTLLIAPGRGLRRWQVVAVLVLAVLAPLLVVLALVPSHADRAVPVALVNQDVPDTSGSTPIAAGKLLTQNLISQDHAVDWVLTDASTAASGLTDGQFLAVVTIPSDFSTNVATLSTASPVRTNLALATNAQHGYVGSVVADALSAALPAGVSAQLTSQYVGGVLSAFAKLQPGIAQASSAAQTIANGTAQAGTGASEIASGTQQLSSGLDQIGGVVHALPSGVRDLGKLTAAGAAASADLSADLAVRAVGAGALSDLQKAQVADVKALLDAIDANPNAAASTLRARVDAIRADAEVVNDGLHGQDDALGRDAVTAGGVALGAGTIAVLSGPVADGVGALANGLDTASSGAAQLADANTQLAGGLSQLASGGNQLASGLASAAASIPDYTAQQQQNIAAVVAQPIAVATDQAAGPDSGQQSTLAAIAPIALWLGAIATFLVVRPYARAALSTPASTLTLARDGALVATAVAVGQAVLVWVGFVVLGVPPDRFAAAAALSLVTAVSFAFVHQALCAFLPRAGLIVSLIALGVQVVAAGTLVLPALAPAAAGPLSILPLSLALQGAQALVGGSLHEVLGAVVGLAIWAVLGALATLVAISRARGRVVVAALGV
ncbi:hypothetical protein ABCS02_08645 [Microbacterium sp. X-17]|uniref:hypothetical protein n=1 Tax=Microbacterium sp. X-17 TaxID=3144404 RepID=UPI0031F4AE35